MAQANKNHWQQLAADDRPPLPAALPASELTVRLRHGVWFGLAMGIGFALGFLMSFLCLLALVGFIVSTRFPGLVG